MSSINVLPFNMVKTGVSKSQRQHDDDGKDQMTEIVAMAASQTKGDLR